MDSETFDGLTKRISGFASRRSLLRGLSAASGGAALAVSAGALPFRGIFVAEAKNNNKCKKKCKTDDPCKTAKCKNQGNKKKCVISNKADGTACGNEATCQAGTCVCPTEGCIITVTPSDMVGWQFYNDQKDKPIFPTMEGGPGDPPLGDGSALLEVASSARGKLLSANIFNGTPLSDFEILKYTVFVGAATSGTAPTLQLGVTRNLATTGFQGRLVYVPSATGNIPTGVWTEFNVLADNGSGNWFFSRSNQSWDGACPLSNPCNLSEVLTQFPDISIHPTGGDVQHGAGFGFIGFKVGSGEGAVDANVDSVEIKLDGQATTIYNFEPDPEPEE